MKVEHELQVADARDAYFRWNTEKTESLTTLFGEELARAIKLIPLFFQINHKLLPGYIGPDVPAGVYAYKPDAETINDAISLNNKFRYQQEGVIKNAAIDAVFIQNKLITQKNYCWVFYRSALSKEEVADLKNKAHKISQWFSVKGLKLDVNCVNATDFHNNADHGIKLSKSSFLEFFYSESLLLAGKYPIWWLVPPTQEKQYSAFVEHIKQARFVDNDGFIELGNTLEENRGEFLSYAIEQVQQIKQSAETSLVELLLVDNRSFAWPEADGLSIRLKSALYSQQEKIQVSDILVDILHESFARYPQSSHVLKPARLFSSLKNISGNLNPLIIDKFIGENTHHPNVSVGIEKIISFLNLFKALTQEARQVFSNIVSSYSAGNKSNKVDQSLVLIARNMLVFLSENADSVPLYNNKETADIILNRILLRHNIKNETADHWSLVLATTEGQEKIIEGFSSLLGLLAWCWLNRLINHSTQVSIDCPAQQVKQTEARYVLEILMQQLNPELISAIPAEAFENPVRPLQSLVFVNLATQQNKTVRINAADDPLSFGINSLNLVTHCEQLIVNSWGDVYTKLYTGDLGILQCLCEWTHHTPLDSLSRPQRIQMFGHGTGDSTYMAQRIDQVYKEMLAFFYSARQESGRFILRLSGEYSVITVEQSLLKPHKIGGNRQLLEYLQAPLESYQATAVERLAYAEYPLSEIYQLNKENVFQIFFQLIRRNCHTWVLDEKGSLWQDVADFFERESYLTQWLLSYRNFLRRLSKIKNQSEKLPGLEVNQISINQLGGIEFYPLAADEISGNKHFFDLQISIKTLGNLDQLSLICDGRLFDYTKLKQNVLIECVQYLSARMIAQGKQPVYVTDIDAPLSLFNVASREQIQMTHLLKLKGNFERRINQLLEG